MTALLQSFSSIVVHDIRTTFSVLERQLELQEKEEYSYVPSPPLKKRFIHSKKEQSSSSSSSYEYKLSHAINLEAVCNISISSLGNTTNPSNSTSSCPSTLTSSIHKPMTITLSAPGTVTATFTRSSSDNGVISCTQVHIGLDTKALAQSMEEQTRIVIKTATRDLVLSPSGIPSLVSSSALSSVGGKGVGGHESSGGYGGEAAEQGYHGYGGGYEGKEDEIPQSGTQVEEQPCISGGCSSIYDQYFDSSYDHHQVTPRPKTSTSFSSSSSFDNITTTNTHTMDTTITTYPSSVFVTPRRHYSDSSSDSELMTTTTKNRTNEQEDDPRRVSPVTPVPSNTRHDSLSFNHGFESPKPTSSSSSSSSSLPPMMMDDRSVRGSKSTTTTTSTTTTLPMTLMQPPLVSPLVSPSPMNGKHYHAPHSSGGGSNGQGNTDVEGKRKVNIMEGGPLLPALVEVACAAHAYLQ
jgi:hypothetical protein